MSSGENDAQEGGVYVVPWDGVYRIQSVAYPEQKIGLQDFTVVSRQKDPVHWDIKATSVGEENKIIIQSGSHYIGADYKTVVYNTEPYEWHVSYREIGRWTIRSKSGFLMYLPDGYDGTKVGLIGDGSGDYLCWRFIPIRPPSN